MVGHHRHVVVAREDGCQDDGRRGGLRLHDAQDCFETPVDVGHLGVVASGRHGRAHVVGTGEQNDDLWVDAVQFAVFQAPQDVLHGVGAPAEIGRIPAEEILLPVGQQLGVVGCAPAARDRVALEIDVDAALVGLLEQLSVRSAWSSGPFARLPCRPGCAPAWMEYCLRNLSAQAIKYFQLGPSVWPPSCWRQASWPSSRPSFTGGIFSVR